MRGESSGTSYLWEGTREVRGRQQQAEQPSVAWMVNWPGLGAPTWNGERLKLFGVL